MTRISYYNEMIRKINFLRVAPKLWNYAKYRFYQREVITSIKRYTPQIGSLILTKSCNLNCGYCAVKKVLDEGRENQASYEATLEKVKNILANPLFHNCHQIDLMGGEPFLVKDLDIIVAYLKNQGRITNVTTNGLLLYERIKDLKYAGISRINVSLYDANRSVLERDLEKVNNIFPVHASIVLLRSMVEKESDKLLEIIRFAYATGCLGVRFSMYRPMGIAMPEEIISDIHPAYLEFKKKVESVFPDFCFWTPIVRTKKVKKLCSQLWQRINCDILGNILICCGIYSSPHGKNSNLFENEPDVIYNHPAIVDMRRKLIDPECDPPDPCKMCNLLGDPGW